MVDLKEWALARSGDLQDGAMVAYYSAEDASAMTSEIAGRYTMANELREFCKWKLESPADLERLLADWRGYRESVEDTDKHLQRYLSIKSIEPYQRENRIKEALDELRGNFIVHFPGSSSSRSREGEYVMGSSPSSHIEYEGNLFSYGDALAFTRAHHDAAITFLESFLREVAEHL
jgi:hypothetical protein